MSNDGGKEKENIFDKIILQENSTKTLTEPHTCKMCSGFPHVCDNLNELNSHLFNVHNATLFDYAASFDIRIFSMEENIDLDGVNIKKLIVVKNDEVKQVEEFVKKKRFLKINGEIVKRKMISRTESFERRRKMIKRNKINQEEVIERGLEKEMLNVMIVNNTIIINRNFFSLT